MNNIVRVIISVVGSVGFLFSLPLFIWPLIGLEMGGGAVKLLPISIVSLVVGIVCLRYIEGFQGWKGPVILGVLFPTIIFGSFFVLMFALEGIFKIGSKGFDAAIIGLVVSMLLLRKLRNHVRKNYA